MTSHILQSRAQVLAAQTNFKMSTKYYAMVQCYSTEMAREKTLFNQKDRSRRQSRWRKFMTGGFLTFNSNHKERALRLIGIILTEDMPRYLGLNYWNKVVSQRREFFNQSLLTVPNHLEQVESYVHKNYRTDCSSWKFWLNQHCQEIDDDSTSKGESSTLKEINNLCNKVEDEELDKFESTTVSKQIGEDIFEVVPSSNPESLFSSDSDECDLLRACDFTFDKRFEIFEEENLDNYQTDYEKDCLEEIFTSDHFNIVRKEIPQQNLLLKRLHSRAVQDPLSNVDGEVYTEKTIFGDNLRVSVESENEYASDVCTTNGFEQFEKHLSSNLEEIELEEILTPFLLEKEQVNVQMPTKIFNKDTQENYLESIPLLESSEKVQDVVFLEEKHDGIESGSFSPIATNTRTFVELNNEPKNDLSLDLPKAFMESPLQSPGLPVQLENGNVDFLKTFQAIQPQIIPFAPTDKVNFLRQFEMEGLEIKVWQHEKYFDEILALRLQEPDVGGGGVCLSTQSFNTSDIKKQLQVVVQTGLCELELQLPWDPFHLTRDLMTNSLKPEHLDCIVGEKQTEVVSSSLETFHKFECHEFCDLTDIMIDIPECSTASISGTSGACVEREVKSCAERKPTNPQVQTVVFTKQVETSCRNMPNSNKQRENMKTTPSFAMSSDQVSNDPLQNFLSMRKISLTSKSQSATEKSNSKPSKSPRCIVKPLTPMTCQLSTAESVSQHSVINIKLSGPFETIFHALEDCAEPYISVLKDRGEINGEQNFASLNPDTTRFLLKQREKRVHDSQQDSVTDDTYRVLLIVHSLSGAADLLENCCLESAISYLSAMQEKHCTVLGESLEDIRQKLFIHQCSFHQKSILHPKIASICKEVENGLNKITKYEGNKVLIVLKRPLQTLMLSLKNALSTNGQISPVLLESTDEVVTESIQEHNCLIASVTNIKHLLLKSYSLIIEYEYQEGSFLENNCATQHSNFIGYLVQDAGSKKHSGTRVSTKDFKTGTQIQVTVIGSQSFTCEKEVLQILETRHNVVVFERDYGNLSLTKKLFFAEIIIDEQHGITIHSLNNLTEDWQVEQLTRKLVVLSVQMSYCWVILYSFVSKGYIFQKEIISNISKLHAALGNISNKPDKFQCNFKILLSTSQDDMACIIRTCCNHCIKVSTAWKEENWCRKWMKEDISSEESFLLGFPCFNTFSAQLLLSRVSLSQLLSASFKKLSTIAPELPSKIFKCFQKLMRFDSGLKLCVSSPETEQNSIPDDFTRNDLQIVTSAKINSPDARELVRQSKILSQNQGFSKHPPHIEEQNDIDRRMFQVKAIPTMNAIKDKCILSRKMFSDYEPDVHLMESKMNYGVKHKMTVSNIQKATQDVGDSMSLPCMKQCENVSQESNGEIQCDSQEFLKPNQYVLAEMEARNLQRDAKSFQKQTFSKEQFDNDLDFESSIVVHSQGVNYQPIQDEKRSDEDIESLSYDSELKLNSKLTGTENAYSNDEFFRNKLQFQSRDKYDLKYSNNFNSTGRNYTGLSQTGSSMSNICVGILDDQSQSSQLETYFQRRKGVKIPTLDKQTSDFDITSSSKEFEQQNDCNLQSDLSTASLSNYVRKAQNISEGFWSRELVKSSQFPVSRLNEDSPCMTRSLSRRPILSSHFSSSTMRPPMQRVSIGLAQPLRRTTERNVENHGAAQSAVAQFTQPQQWITEEDSPPMDLEPELQSPKLCSFSTQNKDKEYLMPETAHLQKRGAVKGNTSLYRNANVEEDYMSSKKKKLSYKPLPGKQCGQTILTFR